MPNADAEAKKELGNKAFAAKDYDGAIKHYTAAIAIDSKNCVYYSNRSACYGGKQEWASAAKDAKECIKVNSSFLKGYYRLAKAQSEQNEFDAALVTIKQGLAIDSDNSQLQKQMCQIKAKRADQAAAPPARNLDVASCWICHGEGANNDDGEPLRRECSCRGSQGFAHLSCLVEHASYKSMLAVSTADDGGFRGGCLSAFRCEWRKCPSCIQPYQGTLLAELAVKFEAFVEERFPDDKYKRVDVLNHKMYALPPEEMNCPRRKAEVANELLLVIEAIRASEATLPRPLLDCKVNALNVLGVSSLNDHTKESAKTALGYFEEALDICKDLGWAIAIAMVEDNIARANDYLEDNGDTEGVERQWDREVVERLRNVHHQFATERGAATTATIDVGLESVRSLIETNRTVEGVRFHTKLLDTCRQVHGPDHCLTEKVESLLARITRANRLVVIKWQGELQCFLALRYEDDGKKCVVQGPIANPRNTEAEETITILSEDIFLNSGTPVVCQGLPETIQLNGKIGDVRSCDHENGVYTVHFEDDGIDPHSIELKFLRILFDLPGE